MTADQWTRAVRQQLGVGRVLPLGGPGDGAWITEEAAGAVLRRAAAAVRGVRLGALRIALADPADTPAAAVVPPPPSALPPGPLRVGAEFAASADPTAPGGEPLPVTAARLRAALAAAAAERLGLTVTDVDLRVTGLLDSEEPVVAGADEEPATPPGRAPEGIADTDESRVAAAALSVPGVTRLTGVLGGLGRAVHIEDRPGPEAALPRRHVRVELAVAPHLRTLDVTHEVRTAVTAALPDHPSVAVLVTAVG